MKQGDKVQLAGLTQELRLMKRSSTVTTASHAIRASVPSVPRFRPVHEEVRPLLLCPGASIPAAASTSSEQRKWHINQNMPTACLKAVDLLIRYQSAVSCMTQADDAFHVVMTLQYIEPWLYLSLHLS